MKTKNIGFFAGNTELSSCISIFMKNMFLKTIRELKIYVVNIIKKLEFMIVINFQ